MVVLPKKKRLLGKKPDQTEKAADLAFELYQIDSVVRGDQRGPLLAFVARIHDGPSVVGAGFVSDDDADNSDRAIMNAIRSIARLEAKDADHKP